MTSKDKKSKLEKELSQKKILKDKKKMTLIGEAYGEMKMKSLKMLMLELHRVAQKVEKLVLEQGNIRS